MASVSKAYIIGLGFKIIGFQLDRAGMLAEAWKRGR
jgi:hypothetical protein